MKAKIEAQKPVVTEQVVVQTAVKSQIILNQPTPIADGMRKQAAERLANEQKLQAEKEAAEAEERAKRAAQ